MTGFSSSIFVFAVGRGDQTGNMLLGTAFAVGPNRVATAYHVVAPNDDKLFMVLPKTSDILAYQDTSERSWQTWPLKIVAADPIRDLCVLEFAPSSGQLFASYAISSTDTVPPGSPVVTMGFPHASTGRMVLTQQATQVGARILVESGQTKNKQIVLNTQATAGQSGGPVFNSSMNAVVAVLLGSFAPGGGGAISLGGVDPATLHQTTHAISAEYLAAMI